MHRIAVVLAFLLSILTSLPTWAQGEIVITHAKALAGGITPGDGPGYPISLSHAGAYVLGSNLFPTLDYGIVVIAQNVDINMNGFTLNGSGTALKGIVSVYSESRIHHGVITRFREDGIYLRNPAWTWSIENMQIVRNGDGIEALSTRHLRVIDSVIALNAGWGIAAGNEAFIRGNSISGNAFNGISCSDACHIEGNNINGNASGGISITGGFVIGNTISNNIFEGIKGSSATGLANNMLINNNNIGTRQISTGVTVHPNTCIGKPCFAP